MRRSGSFGGAARRSSAPATAPGSGWTTALVVVGSTGVAVAACAAAWWLQQRSSKKHSNKAQSRRRLGSVAAAAARDDGACEGAEADAEAVGEAYVKQKRLRFAESKGDEAQRSWWRSATALGNMPHTARTLIRRQVSMALGSNADRKWRLPRTVILLRHGESLGNHNENIYRVVPDWQIPLTDTGREQAALAASSVMELVGSRKVVLYYSPYKRTVETMDALLSAIPPDQVCLVQEEPRIREQDFGNFQDGTMKDIKKERNRFGRFFYRFPDGESGADCYDRICAFMESLFRSFKRSPLRDLPVDEDYVLIVVSHGLTIRLLLMRWFSFTVRYFEKLRNPRNCTPIVMHRKPGSYLYDLEEESWKALGVFHENATAAPVNHFQYPVHYCCTGSGDARSCKAADEDEDLDESGSGTDED